MAAKKTTDVKQTNAKPVGVKKHLKPKAHRLSLEQRIVFDAVLPVIAADAVDQAVDASQSNQTSAVAEKAITNINEPISTKSQPASTEKDAVANINSKQITEKSGATSSLNETSERVLIEGTLAPNNLTAKEIIFIDAVVADLQQYIAARPNADVVLLDNTKNGLDQIAKVLAGRTGIESIHILSHGSSGELAIGNGVLNIENLLSTEHAEDLATIRNALTADADIFIYGCNVAEGSQGAAFINALASATGADIAASDDTTGSASLGADWDLETQTGEVQSFALAAQAWLGTLENLTKAQEFTGKGIDFVVIGNSELTQTTIDGKFAFKAAVTPGTATSAVLTTTLLPTTKSIEAVYLYWYGMSADNAPPNTPLPAFGGGGAVTIAEAANNVDTTAVFTLADNSTVTVTADKTFQETNTAGTRTYQGRRADVTELVLNQPGLLTGTYKLDITGGIYENAKTNTKSLLGATTTVDGVVGSADPIRAWQMVVVYSDAASTSAATVQIYDGLDLVQTATEPAIALSGFKVPTTDLNGKLAITTLGGEPVGNETLVTSTAFPDMASAFANGTSTGTGQGVTVTNTVFEVDILAGTIPAGTTSMTLTAGQGGVADRFFIGTAVLKVAAQPPTIDLNGSATGVGFTGTITDDAAGTSPLVTNGRDINDFGENDITTLKVSVGGVLNGASEKITITSGATVIDIPLNAALAGTPTITFSGVTFKVAFDGSVLTITNNAGATTPMSPVALEALMSGITYSNTAFTLRTGGDRVFNFLAIDNVGLESNPAAAIITVPPPVDTDNDLIPDAADIDDDNDGILDTAEQVPVTLGTFSAIPAGTYPGLATNQGLRISDTTGQYFVDIYLGPRSSSGAPVVFDVAAKTIGSVDSNVDSNEVVELIYSTDKSPKKFELSSLTINNVLSLTAPLNATGVRDAYAFSAPGTWTPIGTPAGAVVTVNTANADSVGVIKVNDPDGNNVLNNIGKFSQATALDATLSDVLLNMAGTTDGHNVRFDFEAGQVTTSMFLFNSGGGNMLWKFAPAMSVLVPRDSDNDGAPDQADLDSDNDGISDLYESTGGTGDALADANKDGTISLAEGGGDADKDGLMDIFDANTTSKSGLTSLGNTPIDTDGDTVRDFVDLDSDGDGIADTIEARPTAGYVPNDGAAASPSLDKDGVLGYFDNTNAVGGAFGGNFIDPVNTDGTALAGGDTRPDYLDLDSDGDLKLDSVESGLPGATTDANRDGISDSIPGVSYANPDGNITNPQVTLANEIGDTTQVAYREVLDTDGDGIGNAQDLDDDNDGILDTEEDKLLVTGNATGTGAFVNNVEFFVWGAAFTNGIQVGDAQSMTLSDGSIVTATVTSVSDATQAGQFRPANSPTFGGSAINGKYNGTNLALYDTNNDVYTSRSVTFSLTGVDAAGFSFKPDVFMTDAEQTDNGETTFYQTNGSGWVIAENLRPISAGFSETGVGTQNLSFRGTNVGSNAYRSNGVTSITVGSTSTTTASSGLQGFVIGIVKTDDADGDGTPNSLDLDSDNDGISDLYESTGGKGDALADTNKDGTVSLAESIAAGATGDGDIDNDGLMDIFDANTANITGTASLGNTPINTDGDGKADYLDLDSDADGIADTIEARLTAGYVPNDGVTASPDTDKDGILGYFDNTNGAGGAFGGNFIDPVNTDAAFGTSGDTTPDYLDSDSDGDLKLDSAESGLPAATADANFDGINDSIPGVSYANPDGNITNPQVTLANEVGDTTQVAYREFLDTDADGVGDAQDIDDDNDGILDTAEQVTVKLDIYSVLPANTYIGQTVSGVRLSDSTGQYFIDIYQGPKTSAGLPLLFDVNNKIIRGDGGTFDGTKLMELVYTTVRSPKPFTLSSTVVGNIQSHSLPTNDSVRDGYAFSEAGTWTPTSAIAPAVVTVNTANADSVGVFKRPDPDGGNTITNIGQFSQVTAIDPTISDVITNMAGAEDGHIVRFDFDVATTTASLYVFNTGGGNMNWRYVPSMEIQVDVDSDGDGAFDRVDLDADNDGISDLYESTGGKGDALADTNKDGTISLAESIAAGATGDGDVDNDGLMDIFDADTTSTSKISGLTSIGNLPIDTDSDGIKDYLDLDSDGDFIADTIEARLTAGYVPNNGVTGSPDTDKDGVLGYFDNTNGAGGTFGGNFIDPVNTDAAFAAGNDTTPDYLDLDSDGDGKVDSAESGLPLSTPVIDANKDGMPDSVPNVSYANPDGDIGANQAGLSNEIGDNTELAYREFLDTDKDGVNDFLDLDDDNDGILDTVEENLVVSRTLDVSQAVVTPTGTTASVVSNLLFGNVTATLSVSTVDGSGFPTRINQIDVSAASSDFTSALFTPALGNPGSVNTNVNLRNDAAARVKYTLTLAQPVDNLVMHVALIEGARWQFTGSQHTESRVSGNASLTYASATRLLDNTNNTLFNTNGFASIRLTPTGPSGITVIQWEQLDDPNNTAGTADTDTFTFSFTQILADTDGDGVNNSKDLDSDNDGISDLFESTGGTGVALKDTNNDGTITLAESVAGGATGDGDIDNDGLMDIFDANTANITGTASLGTTPINTDGDSRADYLDLDSDGDGIADSIEARPTAGYVSYTGTVDTNDDLDNDGVVDIFDQSNGVGGTFGGNFIAPINTDALIANNADTKPDYLDTDSDGDGKLDATESGLSTVTTDANGDGIRDSVNASYANPDGAVTTTLAGIFANEVGDTSQVAFRELNLPPVAVTDTLTLAENTPTVINLLANDTDPNGDTLSLKSINGVAIVAGTAQTITVPNGTVTVSTTGVVTFTPATGYNGPVTFPYEVKDPGGLFAAGTVNITVSSVNDTPVAVADTKTVAEDTPATGNVLANDSDADLATVLTVTQFVVGGVTVSVPAGATGGTTTIAGVGAITVKADGSYTFTPVANFNGAVPTITYTVNDGSGTPNATATSTLNITVTAVNDPPVAVNDTINTTEDTPIVLPLLANDTDVDVGDILSLKSINGVVVTGAAQTIAVPNGTISLTAAGEATFTPNANFNGTVTFPYEIKDQSGLVSQATVTINVAAVNDAPVTAPDTVNTPQNTSITGNNLLTNDTDVDTGTTLTLTGFSIAGEAGPFVVGTPYTIAGVGEITINSDGSYSFTPALNYSGTLPAITYTINDGSGTANATATSTLNITVDFANTAPTASPVTASGVEDSTGIAITLSGADVDSGTPGLASYSIVALPPATQGVLQKADGTPVVAGAPLTLAEAAGLKFVPAQDFNGAVDTIQYRAIDGLGANSTPANINITVTAVNDAPIARDDSFTTNEDTSVVLNLLGNDTDVDNTNAQLSLKSINGTDITPGIAQTINVPNGVVNVTAAGVATFVPNANYNGPVAFDYVVQDPAGLTDAGTVNITVTAVNDTPVAAPETASTLEDTPATGNVLTNDSDIDGNPLTVTQFVVDGQTITVPAGGKGTATLTSGVLEIGSDGAYTFTPAANFNGPVPVATYTINDGSGTANATATSTLTLSVTSVNDAPVAVTDTIATPEDTPVTLNLIGNDTDVDGDTLTLKSIDGTNITPGVAQSITVPNGTVNITSAGVVTFTPTANYNGPATFKYLVQDPSGLTSEGTVNITVNPVNDAPVLSPEVDSTSEDTPTTGNLIANDTDIDGNTLTVTQFEVAGQTITIPAGGSDTLTLASGRLTIDSNGGYTFTPAPNFNGAVPQITYTVSDGTTTRTSTLDITVTPVNDAPVAVDDTVSVAEDTPTTLTLLTNDTDADGDTLTLKSINGTAITPGVAQSITVPNGTVTVTAAGVVSFTPTLNYNGPATFDYMIQDGKGGEDTGTVNITVTPVNDSPVAAQEKTSTPEDTPATGNVLSNDSDVDGNLLTITQFVVDGQTITVPAGGTGTATLPSGTLVIGSDGAYTFTPAANFIGVVPTVTYTVNDGSGAPNGSVTSTLELTVTPVNDAPIAVDDTVSVAEDTPTTLTLLTNDTDADGDTLTLKSINGTAITPGVAQSITVPNGTVTVTAAGVVSFTPTLNYNGPATFDYVVQDGKGGEDTGTVNITVTPVNDSPVATPETATTPEDTPAIGNVLSNDIDIDGNTLTISTFTVAGQTITVPAGGTGTATLPSGTLAIGSDGAYTFTPATNFNGVVPTVTYTVNDGSGAPNGAVTSTLSLTVTPVNDAPVATPVSATGAEDASSIPLNLSGTDVDGTIASVTVTTLPPASQGVLQKADGTPVIAGSPLTPAEAAGLKFVPAANFNGIVGVEFKVTDNLGLASNPETAFVTITPVNDRPVATTKSINTIEGNNGTPVDVNLAGTDIEDGLAPTVTVTSLPDPLDGVLFFADGVTPVVAGVPMTAAEAATLKFKADQDFAGILTIPFTVTDSGNDSTLTGGTPLTSTPGSFVIDVQNVNDAPTAPNKTGSGLEDTPVSITNLITGVTDADIGDSVKSATINNLPPAAQGVLYYTDASGVKTPVVAGISIPAAQIGSLVFESAPNFNGTVDTIKFVVADQAGELSPPADLVITIAPVNDKPVVAPDVQLVNEDEVATGNVLTNDSDVENNPLTVTQFVVAGQTIPVPTGGSGSATIAGVGELVINADGSYTFTPVNNFNGSVPMVTYTVSDGQAENATSTSTLNIGIGSLNDAPIATATTLTGTEDTDVPVNLAGADTDGTIASVTVTTLPPATEGVLKKADGTPVVAGAPLTPAEAANLVFTPAPQFNGTVTPIEFKVTDNEGLDSASATSTITIAPVNDAPVVAPDLNTVNEDTPATGNVLTNDSDIDNNPLTVTQFVVAGQTITVPTGGSGTANIAGVGDLVINADGSYTFTPATNFNGTVPSVTYTVSDGQTANAISTSTLDITVTAVNDAPIATPATLTGTEDTNLPVNLAGTDLDGTIASVTVEVLPPASQGVLTKADGSPVVAGVALTPTEAATLIFKPALNFNGTVTPIEFKVTDNQGLDSATSLVNISVSAANDAPIATPVTPIGDEDTSITINFGGTDVEDGTPATVTITSLPPASKGVLFLADGITPVAVNTPIPAGDLIFKPALNYNTATDGPLVIPFTVTDSGGLISTPANASITINALNDAPTATPATLTGNEDTPITVSLAGTDVDGTIASVTVTELPPANEGVLTKADGSPVVVGTPLTPAEAASLVFTPALNFNGPVTPIKFTVKDNLGIDSTPATSTITVTAGNDAPIATPVTPSGDEDTPITVNLAGTDVDGTVATVTVTALPPATKGVLYLADGTTPVIANVPLTAAQAASLIFTPAPNYNTAVDGPIVVPFTVTDNNGAVSTSSTASITVNDVNDVPVATSKSLDTPEDTNVGVNLSGTDIDGTVTSIAVTQLPDPAEGILYFADGVTPVQANVPMTPAQAAGLIFNPTANYNSTDFNLVEIKFTVTDEDGGVSTPGTFVIDIADANDSPVATAVSTTTPEDTPVTITLDGTDVDIGDSVVSVSLVTLPSPVQGILYLADGTTLVVAGIDYPPGSFVFKPNPNFNGTVPPFNFTVKDTVGQVSTPVAINLSIGDVNDPPTAINAVVTATEDTPVSVSLVGNDIDGTIASVTITDVPPASQGVLTKADGTVINANDVLTPTEAANLIFTPAANFNGPVTPISFTVTDDDGGISPAGTATLTVNPVNDPPVATPATAVGDEDTPITVALTGTDVEGPIASVTITSLPPADKGVLTLNGVPVTANQVLTPADAALLVFTPTPNSNGPASFTFTVTDSEGTTSPAATATINVTPVNDAPVATPATPIGNEDTPIPVSLTGTDIEGPIASVTVTAVPPASEGVLTKADGTVVNTNDVLTPSEAANLIFTPAANFNGPVTPISFTVTDSNGTESPPATSTITVTPVNDPPVATPATAVGDEDTPITVALTGTDVEGPIASVTITSLPPADKGVLTLNGVPVTANQVLTPADAALLVFTPTPNSNGPASFTFTVTDSEGTTSPAATATINVTPVNDAPVATPATPIGNEDTPIPVSLTGTDVEGPIASVTVTALPPANEGVLTLNGVPVTANQVLTPAQAANLIFTPAANFNGPVTPISFTVTDSNGTESPPATSTITVTPANDPPVATPASVVGSEDTPITVALTGTDVEGPIASVTITSLPPADKGVLTLNGVPVTVNQVLTPAQAATLVFTPALNTNGPATFTFTVTDSEGTTSPAATATVNVTPVNDAPVATPATPIGNEDTPIPVSLTGTDVEGPIASVTVTALPPANEGVLTLNGVPVTANQVLTPAQAANLIFTPAANFNGPVTPISFTVRDSNGTESPPATSTITVNDVVNPPVATAVKASVSSEQAVTISLTGVDSDGTIASITIKSLPPASEGVLTLSDGTAVTVGQVLTPAQAASLRFKGADGFNGTSNIDFIVTDDEGLESAIASASLSIASDNGLFEQLVSPPLRSVDADGSSDGNTIFGASSSGFNPPFAPSGTPITDGLIHTTGLVSQANSAGVFSADGPAINEINSYSSDLNNSAMGTSQGLFVQHAVRGLPVTSEVNIFVQNAVRQSQIESLARHIGVSTLNTATNAVTSLIMPFELGAPNHIETDFTVQGAFDNDASFDEDAKNKTSQVGNQEAIKTLSNTQFSANQDAVKMQNKLINPLIKDKKAAASSFGKQVDMANKKLKSTRIFG